MFLKKFSKLKKLKSLLILFSLVGVIYSLQKEHHNKFQLSTQANNHNEQIELARINLKTQQLVPTFGFKNIRADLTYLQFVQYLGNETARKQTGYTLVPSYFETVVQYDPNFTQANLSLSVANSMYAGQPEKTVMIMEKILASSSPDLDDSYLIWFAKGLDELLFLGDNQAALNSYKNSAKSAINQDNNNLHQITKINQRKIDFLATNPDTTAAQITAWKTVLPHVIDPHNHQRISDRIAFLEQNLSD